MGILYLPAEIRALIFVHLFRGLKVLAQHRCIGGYPSTYASVSCTCRTFFTEAKPVFFHNATFELRWPGNIDVWSQQTETNILSQIRRVTFSSEVLQLCSLDVLGAMPNLTDVDIKLLPYAGAHNSIAENIAKMHSAVITSEVDEIHRQPSSDYLRLFHPTEMWANVFAGRSERWPLTCKPRVLLHMKVGDSTIDEHQMTKIGVSARRPS